MSVARTLVVGHVTHDRYGGDMVAGGCAFYGALAHAGLGGAEVTLLAGVGDDFACDRALAGLDVRLRRGGQTTLFTNIYPEGAPRVQLIEAQAPEMVPEAFGHELEVFFGAPGPKLVHLAPVMGEVDLARWLAVIPDDVMVGINVQGWIKEAGPRLDAEGARLAREAGADMLARRVVQRRWEVGAAHLAGVDVACMSTEDLLGQGGLLAGLKAAVPLVAVTNGAYGSTVFAGDECWEVGVWRTDARDPTGAGDVYTAGLLSQRLQGASASEAARWASAAASVAVEGRGPEALGRLGEAAQRFGDVSARRLT